MNKAQVRPIWEGPTSSDQTKRTTQEMCRADTHREQLEYIWKEVCGSGGEEEEEGE